MVRVLAVLALEVQRQSGVYRQRTHELDRQAGVVLTAHRLRHGCVEHEVRAAGDIQRAETERLVHRHERLSETRDTRLVTDALRQCLTECDAAVLDRMVAVHLEVALAGERETEAGMHGKAVQHMVEKADAGVDPAFAALERQLERNVGFLGLSFDFSGSHRCFPPQSAPRWSLRARPDARSARAR